MIMDRGNQIYKITANEDVKVIGFIVTFGLILLTIVMSQYGWTSGLIFCIFCIIIFYFSLIGSLKFLIIYEKGIFIRRFRKKIYSYQEIINFDVKKNKRNNYLCIFLKNGKKRRFPLGLGLDTIKFDSKFQGNGSQFESSIQFQLKELKKKKQIQIKFENKDYETYKQFFKINSESMNNFSRNILKLLENLTKDIKTEFTDLSNNSS